MPSGVARSPRFRPCEVSMLICASFHIQPDRDVLFPFFKTPSLDDGFAAGRQFANLVCDDAALRDGSFFQPPLEECQFLAALATPLDFLFSIADAAHEKLLN